jgi:hypothetical protein
MTLDFFRQCFENTQIQNFMKIHRVGSEWFHADGQSNMMKVVVAFRNFAKTPRKFSHILLNVIEHGCCYRGPRTKFFEKF